MIICTEDDKNFHLYQDKIKNRKVIFTIKQIFIDWWQKFLNKYPNITIRDIVHSSVEKLITCKTLATGFTLYFCSMCTTKLFVCHTCKSRFCSSCGNKYNEQRGISIFSKLFRAKHRHVVFTIPEDLRIFFREDRSRLKLLFKASELTIKFWFKNKHKNLTPAFISVLHTYGRDLNFNPHIHMILLDGGISNNDFVKINFFSYASLRKSFMKVILDLLDKELGKTNFRKIKNNMYFTYKDGFYVYAPPSKFKDVTGLLKYVCRYLARAVMAESRIIDYDGTFVTFWYQRHDDEKIVIEKIHAINFIERLIIHIPDKHFKYIRYYGGYHNSTIINIDIVKLVSKEILSWKKSLLRWRDMLIISFKKDPLKCDNCNNDMVYFDTVFT